MGADKYEIETPEVPVTDASEPLPVEETDADDNTPSVS